MNYLDKLAEHYSIVKDTLAKGKAGQRAQGLLDMVEGNVNQGLPMLNKNPGEWDANDVLGVAMGGTIAGRAAKAFNPQTGDIADEMRAAGRSRDDIWNATAEATGQPSFFDGDGNLKWEIDDSGMSFRRQSELGEDYGPAKEYQRGIEAQIKAQNAAGKGQMDMFPGALTRAKAEARKGARDRVDAASDDVTNNRMDNIVKHEKLDENYPGLLHETRTFQDDRHGNSGAQWTSDGHSNIRWGIEDDYTATKGLLGHEINHTVQGVEGHPLGGDPLDFAREKASAQARVSSLNEEMRHAITYRDEARDMGLGESVIEQQQRYDTAMREKMSLIEKVNQDPYESYWRLAGEADARAAQKRMDLTSTQRVDKPFYEDYDVPEDEFIYQYLNPR